MYPRARFGVGPVVSLGRHPTNGNSIIVANLAQDIDPLLEWSAEQIAQALFTAGSDPRPPLKEVRVNRCPFVAPLEVLTEENIQRCELDMRAIKERARRLRQPGLADKLARVYLQNKPAPNTDVDAALYDGFLQDEDRSRCQHLHDELSQGRWQELDFKDQRLPRLARRMKARSFTSLLDQQEAAAWRNFVADKLAADGDWLNLEGFESRLQELSLEPQLDAAALQVLQSLAEHAHDLRTRYQL